MEQMILVVGAEANPSRVEIQQLCDKLKEAYGRVPVEITEEDFRRFESTLVIGSGEVVCGNSGDIIRVRGNYYLEPTNREKYGRMSKGEKHRGRKERWS